MPDVLEAIHCRPPAQLPLVHELLSSLRGESEGMLFCPSLSAITPAGAARSMFKLPWRVLQVTKLEQTFSKTFATKELDNVRREGLFAVDSALHVPMQTRVFPLIHEYEEMIREWRDQREVLLAAERRRFQIQSDLFDAKMDMLVKSGVNFAGGHCGDSISRRKTKQGRKSTPEVDRLTEELKAVETILFRLRLTFRNKNNIINLVYQVIDHPARHPHSKTRRRKVAERNVDNVRASKGDHRVSTGPRGVHDTRVGEMQNLYTAARS